MSGPGIPDNLRRGNTIAVTVEADSSTPGLPSGAATEAKQDTQITAEQAIQTSVELIDDTVKAEDEAHGSGDKGIMALGVRKDSAGTLASADGDYTPLQMDNAGSVRVRVTAGTLDGALPAGTNAIGKLAANSGVDIGDVDVTSLPRSQSGPGQPGTAVDSYTHAAINLAAGANQVLVSAPGASKQIWVYGIFGVCSAAGTVSFQDEDDVAISGIMPFAANSGPAMPPSGNFSMPIWKLATNKALEVDIVTAEFDGWIDYAIVSV